MAVRADPPDREITVVLIGRSGSGKSTLRNNLLDRPLPISPQSEGFTTGTVIRNGVTWRVTDTPGLKGGKDEILKDMERLSSYTKGKADLLLYCLPVSLGSDVDDTNPVIMECLQTAFGKAIWQHCILVLTMSNLTWHQFNQRCRWRDSPYS